MLDETLMIIFAMVCLTMIEVVALILGYDGALLATVVGVFAAVVGYKVKAVKG